MSTKSLEQTAVEAVDSFKETLSTVATKVGELAQEHGPVVADTIFTVVRVDAMTYLANTVLLLVLGIVASVCFVKILHPWVCGLISETDGAIGLVWIVAVISIGALWVVALARLTNWWKLVALFEPKLYIAYRLLEKVM